MLIVDGVRNAHVSFRSVNGLAWWEWTLLTMERSLTRIQFESWNASHLVPFWFNNSIVSLSIHFTDKKSDKEEKLALFKNDLNERNKNKSNKLSSTKQKKAKRCWHYDCMFFVSSSLFLVGVCGINACATTRHMHNIMSIVLVEPRNDYTHSRHNFLASKVFFKRKTVFGFYFF